MARFLWLISLACVVALPPDTAIANTDDTFHARVVEILSEESVALPGTDASYIVQTMRAVTTDGEVLTLENDRVPLKVGDYFFGMFIEGPEGRIYSVRDPDRRLVLIAVVSAFVVSVVAVGRWVGVRSLISLGLSLFALLWWLTPLVVSGASPFAVSATLAVVVLCVATLVTHGVSWKTLTALVASFISVGIAMVISSIMVSAARVSGFASDEASILNLTTGGAINMEGVLLGALIIGVLGIVDDLTITQVSTVQALHQANPHMDPRALYHESMRVGRDHLGAVVNTLVLAYAGSALPLLMLFSLSPSSPLTLINSDIITIEIIRAAVGGMCLAASIPLATALAVVVRKKMAGSTVSSHGHIIH